MFITRTRECGAGLEVENDDDDEDDDDARTLTIEVTCSHQHRSCVLSIKSIAQIAIDISPTNIVAIYICETIETYLCGTNQVARGGRRQHTHIIFMSRRSLEPGKNTNDIVGNISIKLLPFRQLYDGQSDGDLVYAIVCVCVCVCWQMNVRSDLAQLFRERNTTTRVMDTRLHTT